MKIFYLASFLLLAQLAVVGGVLSAASRMAGEGRGPLAGEAFRPLAWGSLLAGITALGLRAISGRQLHQLLEGGGWVYIACAAPTTAGCYLLLVAGRMELAGRLGSARRLARLGGFLAAGGGVAQLAPGLWRLGHLLQEVTPGSRPAILSLGLVGCLAAGLVGLLGGLSGKPRPSGHVCAVLVAFSSSAWVMATWF